MSEDELQSVPHPDQWEKLKPIFETREKHFLTLNGEQAVELQLAEATVKSRAGLAERYALAEDFYLLEHTRTDTAVMILNHPFVTGVLLVIGLIALYIELQAPGTAVGGLIAGLCFALFFWSRFLGGTAGWLEVILFVSGLAFIAMELFVIPGFGVAGIGGLLLLITSMVMASQSFLVPQNSRELNTTLTQLGVVGGSAFVFIVGAALISRHLGSIPVVKSLVLEVPSTSTTSGEVPGKDAFAYANVPVVVGEIGTADSPLRPAGKARFGDHYIDVVADGVFIDRGRPVRVSEISGYRIVVREADTA